MKKSISKTICIALLAVGIALFSFSACADANAQTARSVQPERWEYKMVRVGCCCFMDDMTNELNQLGGEGWKLVSVTSIDSGARGF